MAQLRIAQLAIHETAKVKNDSKFSGYVKHLTSLLQKRSAIIHVITIMLVLSLPCRIRKNIGKFQQRNQNPIQSKLKLMKVVYSRHSLISLKNILSKVGKTTTVSNLILKLEQLLVVNNASDCM